MNFFIKEIALKNSGIELELMIAIIIGILLVLSIVILTIIKKLKD